MDMATVNANLDLIKTMAQEHGLALLYVYGSLAKNRMGQLSDIDLAVQKKDGQKLSWDETLKLIGQLQELFQREDIDLVDLLEASPLLRMRILQTGYLAYAASFEDKVHFSYKTISDYLATSFLRKSFAGYLNKAVGIQ